MNSKVLISIGANTDSERQMQRARERLLQVFPDIIFTESIATPAYGMGDYAPLYTNMLATFHTDVKEQCLVVLLKTIEHELGDTPTLRRKGLVLMDLDILRFAGRRRHLEDWQRPYIKQLITLL